jgi:hypothetical protein
MTTPWPRPDHETQTVMCCLCFGGFSFEELSRTPEGDLTDVCMNCRMIEIQMILRKARA